MASPNTPEEMSCLTDFNDDDFWIDIKDRNGDNNYLDADGNDVTGSKFWADNQPITNNGGQELDCTVLSGGVSWFTTFCSLRYKVICEAPLE